MCAFDALWHLDTRVLHLVNGALLILLPKNNEAIVVCDYRPISLIHVLRKLSSKVIKRLSLRINDLVHPTQSAFINGRYIQNNFKLVQASAKDGSQASYLKLILQEHLILLLGPFSSKSCFIWVSQTSG
jgi:hypothetical protein